MSKNYLDFMCFVDESVERFVQCERHIFQWIRNSRGRKVGVMLAYLDNGDLKIGWSLCNRKDSRKFDKNVGIYYALKKATKPDISLYNSLPEYSLGDLLHPQVAEFEGRAKAYFKQAVYA